MNNNKFEKTATKSHQNIEPMPNNSDNKKEVIQYHFEKIMETLGLDMTDDSLKDTPKRVSKMFVDEIFSGLDKQNFPSISLFENNFQYRQMLLEKDIDVYSTCEHHFLPIFGKAHVAYYASDKVIGLSKLNRVVDFYCRRPQVQERLTTQIGAELRHLLQTEDVAVCIEARHMCVESRGVKHRSSETSTYDFSGKFLEEQFQNKFLRAIKD